MPTVSIIVTCYNQGIYLKDAINSILKSTYKDWECIIIDDGSTDSTPIIATELCSKFNDIRYIRQKNQGVCIARNNAIEKANGKYILCIDADDKISEDYINLCVNVLDNDNETTLVVCNYQNFGAKTNRVILEEYSLEKLMWRNLFVNCSMYRKLDFERVGGYNNNMKGGLEDWDFWLSLLENGGKVRYLEGIHFFYRRYTHSESRNSKANLIKQDLMMTIKRNHSSLYLNKYSSPIYSSEYVSLLRSKEYKIGKFLLIPFRFLKMYINNLFIN